MNKKRWRDSLPYFVNREFFILLLAAVAVVVNLVVLIME